MNCCGKNQPFSAANCSAFEIAPFIPSAPGVSTNSAPYARSKLRRSKLIVSGITSTDLYPLAAAIIARPIPVFPLVGSMIVLSSFSSPFFSAASIIASAIRSFTLEPGLKNSSFKYTSASSAPVKRFNFTNGVLPTKSITEFPTLLICHPLLIPSILICFVDLILLPSISLVNKTILKITIINFLLNRLYSKPDVDVYTSVYSF